MRAALAVLLVLSSASAFANDADAALALARAKRQRESASPPVIQGTVTQEPAAAPVVKATRRKAFDVTITVPETWDCSHCDRWLTGPSYELQRKGHTVGIIRDDSGTAWPRIQAGGKTFVGYVSAATILRAMKPTGPSATGAVVRGVAAVPVVSSVPFRDPRPGHWSFPGGDIRSHLMRPPHNFSASDLAGLSYEQLLTLHDLSHEQGYRPSRVMRSQPVAQAYCPTCPRGR